MGNYLSVRNFKTYQHYKFRSPPWIKLHREFWTDHTLLQLSVTERLLFIGCCSLASELDNQIPDDPKYLSHRLGFPISRTHIQALVTSTLLNSTLLNSTLSEQIASIPLADCKHDASEASNPVNNGRNYRNEARQVLCFLNEKSGKKFRDIEVNLAWIEARLKSGVDVQTCKSLIARKVRDWGTDPKMSVYLRPETLFNKTKFETYLAEVTP